MSRMQKRGVKQAIGKIIVIGTILITCYVIMFHHSQYLQSNKTDSNIVNMEKVVGFETSEDGLQLYFEDGSGYWIER